MDTATRPGFARITADDSPAEIDRKMRIAFSPLRALKEMAALRWIVGTVVEYAPYQEYGTVFQSGQPYMRPAVERVRGPFVEAWRKFLRGLR